MCNFYIPAYGLNCAKNHLAIHAFSLSLILFSLSLISNTISQWEGEKYQKKSIRKNKQQQDTWAEVP